MDNTLGLINFIGFLMILAPWTLMTYSVAQKNGWFESFKTLFTFIVMSAFSYLGWLIFAGRIIIN